LVKKSPGYYPGNERSIVCAIDKYVEDGSEVSIGVCRNREAAGVWQQRDQHRQRVERDHGFVMLSV